MTAGHPDIEGCVWCGTKEGGLHDHHVIHRSQGGSDEPWNLLPLCYWDHMILHEHPWQLNDLQILHSLVGSSIWRWDKVLAILEKKVGGNDAG